MLKQKGHNIILKRKKVNKHGLAYLQLTVDTEMQKKVLTVLCYTALIMLNLYIFHCNLAQHTLRARKCEIFGICCEGSRIQANYLIDEAESIGTGANSMISYLHHYLESHGVGETDLLPYTSADNWAGQNKNNAMIQYLM